MLLEGWNQAVPALVNAQCSVLQGQVRRANGGLYYRSTREFGEALQALLERPGLRGALADVLDEVEVFVVDPGNTRPGGFESLQKTLGAEFGQRNSATQGNHRRHEQNPEGRPKSTGTMTEIKG